MTMLEVQAVKDRIKFLLKKRRTTENKLAGSDKGLQKQLNNQISHTATLTVATVLRILEYFPDVSADYLLRGINATFTDAEVPQGAIASEDFPVSEGAMTSDSLAPDNHYGAGKPSVPNDTVRFLIQQLEEKDRQINRLLDLVNQSKQEQ